MSDKVSTVPKANLHLDGTFKPFHKTPVTVTGGTVTASAQTDVAPYAVPFPVSPNAPASSTNTVSTASTVTAPASSWTKWLMWGGLGILAILIAKKFIKK